MKPEGVNCGLSEPPANAGEEANHGMELRVFPRRSDITPEYSGCQSIWLQIGSNSLNAGITEIHKGAPVRWWIPNSANPFDVTACNYKNGKGEADNSDACPSELNDDSLIHSLPSGCNKRIVAAKSQAESLQLRANGCEYD